VIESGKAAIQLFVANQQLSKAVEPAVADLDNPAASLLERIAALACRLLFATHHVGDVAMALHRLFVLCTGVPSIGAEMFASALRRVRPLHHDGIENLLKALAVMHVGPGHDERQRDATPVHQQMTLAAFFSPDPSGWGQCLLAPSAL